MRVTLIHALIVSVLFLCGAFVGTLLDLYFLNGAKAVLSLSLGIISPILFTRLVLRQVRKRIHQRREMRDQTDAARQQKP